MQNSYFGVVPMNKTKRAIFEAAIKVFSESGYDGATMDDIAASAGVAKGTLYYHFKSKEEIFKFIIDEGSNVVREELQSALAKETSTKLKLRILCKVQLELVYKNRDLFKVIMSQLWGQEIRQHELRDTIESYIKHLEGYLKDAMAQGFIKKGEPRFMAYNFIGTICASAIYELINEDRTDVNEVIDNLVQYILRGVEIAQ